MKAQRPTYGSIGSISEGTLRDADLFDAFLYECKRLRLSRAERNKVRKIESARIVDADETPDEKLEYDVQELQTILENHAAPYMYFGTHEGDGACFGFWLADLDSFDGLRVNDTSEVPRGYSGAVLHVNDHGNATLYAASRGRLTEVWSCV